MKIAIIQYNAGNIKSVIHAFERLGVSYVLTDDPEEIKAADKVVFPGVGNAITTAPYLKSKGLDQVIKGLTQPVLGICLGMQLLCNHTEEGDTAGIGVFDVNIKKFPKQPGFKVPHMGWNSLSLSENSWLPNAVAQKEVYFVHSYYAELNPWNVATANYILPFCAAMQKNNFYATQFHPEKSGDLGNLILEKFIAL